MAFHFLCIKKDIDLMYAYPILFQFLVMNVMMTLNVLTYRTPTVEIVMVTSWLIPVCARGVILIIIKLIGVKSQEPNNLVITVTHAVRMKTAKRDSNVATANAVVQQATDIMPDPRIVRKVRPLSTI